MLVYFINALKAGVSNKEKVNCLNSELENKIANKPLTTENSTKTTKSKNNLENKNEKNFEDKSSDRHINTTNVIIELTNNKSDMPTDHTSNRRFKKFKRTKTLNLNLSNEEEVNINNSIPLNTSINSYTIKEIPNKNSRLKRMKTTVIEEKNENSDKDSLDITPVEEYKTINKSSFCQDFSVEDEESRRTIKNISEIHLRPIESSVFNLN